MPSVGMKYVLSFSGGKDSTAMLLKLMELGLPLTHVIMYDTGMEFQAVYNTVQRIRPLVEAYGAEFIILKPKNDWLYDMFLRPIRYRDGSGEHYGADWCGGNCRWRTTDKVMAINRFLYSLHDDYIQYIGIAYDEPHRVKYEQNKSYPLVEWKWSEADCLRYCYEKGFFWLEDDVRLYDVLDRVSCWCCKSKNLKELENMYRYLPKYWQMLRALQSRIPRPFRSNGETVFDLEKRFALKNEKGGA